ncbi:acyl carrier protein [Myxococcus landrumensis]|uniref:acyl carrier protein n=1 Tax=Myxococcus landrumensis TaxID=2813577 RepID=UPI001F50C165|nr:acyl carrier protein [Myxococcus landrumus]
MTQQLTRLLAELTQLEVSEIDPSRPWAALGVNSLTLVRLRDGIERDLSVRVAMSVMGSCHTVNELVEQLRSASTAPPVREAPRVTNGHANEKLSDGSLEEMFVRLSGAPSRKGEA